MAKISQPQKDLWDFMRFKIDFTGKEALGDKKNRTLEVYINALERAGYLEQTLSAYKPINRAYKLVLDTGELPPLYRTARREKSPEVVIDRNIDREVELTGKSVQTENELYTNIKKIVEEDGFFDYEKIKEMFFEDDTKAKGYNYTLLDYYKKNFTPKNA